MSLVTIEHELLIQDLRLKLTQLGATNWQCEQFLSWKNPAKQMRLVPDAKFARDDAAVCEHARDTP